MGADIFSPNLPEHRELYTSARVAALNTQHHCSMLCLGHARFQPLLTVMTISDKF